MSNETALGTIAGERAKAGGEDRRLREDFRDRGVAGRNAGNAHPWHTDIETAGQREAVTVWIGLENTTPRSSLSVVPGSHRFGVTLQQTRAEKNSRRSKTSDEVVTAWANEHAAGSMVEQLALSDGEAVVFAGGLWHGSTNTSRRRRTALLLQYAAPETPVRVPDPTTLDWPFRFLDAPQPSCILVRGTARTGVNKLVPGASPESMSSLPVLTSRSQSLGLPRAEDPDKGWSPRGVFRGATLYLPKLGCHVSVLSGGKTPHEPHVHDDEELLIVLSGELDLITVDEASGARSAQRIRPGTVAYYASSHRHTVHNPTTSPATYLMFKWYAGETGNVSPLSTTVFRYDDKVPSSSDTEPRAFAPRRVFEGETRYLRKLHSHFTTLQPGGSYAAHVDAYDVAIITVTGTLETLGRRVEPGSVIFYAAGEPHGMKNIGSEPATYLVFEFHVSGSQLPAGGPGIRKRAYLLLRRTARSIPLMRRAVRMIRGRPRD